MATLGEMLVEARREAGFTTTEVAQRTRIMHAAVQALEEDNFSSVPAAGYVRGYLLSYCKLIGADPRPFLEQYERQTGNRRQNSMGRLPIDQTADRYRHQEHDMNWKVVAVLAAVIVLIAVVVYLVGGLRARNNGNTLPPAPVETTATAGGAGTGAGISEDTRVPFSFTVKAKANKATELKIIVDDAVAYEGSLTSGEKKSYEGVLEAKITIARPNNAVVTQNETNIPIPENGELTLVALE